MESRFAHDFSRVRVHADSAVADDLGARAFALNHDIAFARGEYAPHTSAGRHLLAHELAHVAGAAEAHADVAADDVMRGRAPSFAPAVAPPAIQMKKKTLQETADAVAKDLEGVIAVATWPEIRKVAYPRESAPGIKRGQERRDEKRDELTGLGKIASVDRFANQVRAIQKEWSKFTADQRAEKLAGAADQELKNAGVPGFIDKGKKKMLAKAGFTAAGWAFSINEDLVDDATLSDEQGAEVATASLHEARHAEQYFLAARYSAQKESDPAKIAASHNIPEPIAKQAVAKKFDAKSDKAEVKLGREMFKAHVTNRDKKFETSSAHDDAVAELDKLRGEAETALKDLKASATKTTIFNATEAKRKLEKQMKVVDYRYVKYRKLPSEADAHEVGDAAGEAFKLAPKP